MEGKDILKQKDNTKIRVLKMDYKKFNNNFNFRDFLNDLNDNKLTATNRDFAKKRVQC